MSGVSVVYNHGVSVVYNHRIQSLASIPVPACLESILGHEGHMWYTAEYCVAMQYTWDKQLETWVKSSVMLGGARKEPTVISPKQYCRRFRVAISSYFVSVPSSEQALPCLDPDALM